MKTSPPNAAHGRWASVHLVAVVRVATIVGAGRHPDHGARHDVHDQLTGGLARQRISTTSSTLRRSSCSTAKTHSRPPDLDPTAASNLHLAAGRGLSRGAADDLPAGVADILMRPARTRVFRRLRSGSSAYATGAFLALSRYGRRL